ncbi:hypothetical protein [Flavobacterium lacus]|uniref:Uncharacterized protein n=1 Tax=Flavobacterium lacus TaxID=1353778 RepID=A0A328WTL1_9FLAO|nr:hypothetical protein [Flavobacterium lacus]RAR48635.1 hypothetical protein B0I10_105253 [Flavobacterium lacus]
MKTIFLLITLFFSFLCIGQNIDSLVSKRNNLEWINELKQINSKEEKIKKIIEKIKSDSIVSKPDIPEIIVIKVDKGEDLSDAIRKRTKCKIIFVLTQKNSIRLLDLNQYPKNTIIINYFNSISIDSIEIIEGDKALSLFGTSATCGVVVLKSNNGKLKRAIKKSLKV